MSTKRAKEMRERLLEAQTRLEKRNEASGNDPEATPARQNVSHTMLVAEEVKSGVLSELEASRDEIQALKKRLDELKASDASATVIDPHLVDVPGFNRFAASFDPALDKDFAVFVENIAAFGGNKQPAMVRPSATPGRYDLVFGERRLRACIHTNMPFTVVVADLDDDELKLLRELENTGRKDKSLIERAFSLNELPDPIPYGELETILRSLKISKTSLTRLRAITKVPLDVWIAIPQPQRTTHREAEAICKAYDADPQRVMDLAASITPEQTHKSAVTLLALPNAPQSIDNGRNYLRSTDKDLRLDLFFESSEQAEMIREKIAQLLQKEGITFDPK